MVLVDRLIPPVHANGLQRIRDSWKMPSDSITALFPWPKDFSQGITPVQCHSHNDYWRNVPLFDALAAGCVGVEADVWLDKTSNNLLVGHRASSLSADRTLQSAYIEPLNHNPYPDKPGCQCYRPQIRSFRDLSQCQPDTPD